MLRLEHQPDGNGNGSNNDNNKNREEHEPDEKMRNLSLYGSPTRKVMDYFQIAHGLANNTSPAVPLPLWTFASSTMATHLAQKPTLRMTISEALKSFRLPDLLNAILGCMVCCSNGEPHAVEGWRPATSHFIHSTERLQIWSKIQVQLWTWHKPESVKPAQTLVITPPSQRYPSDCYDCTIISPMANSDWPSGGLNGALIFIPLVSSCWLHLNWQGTWSYNSVLFFASLASTTFSHMCNASMSPL